MEAPIKLYCDYGCPYAQRIEALLHLREVPYERVLVDPRNKPAELLQLSPTGRIPMVTVGDVLLCETGVIANYLAELVGWEGAYPSAPLDRARHRLAIRLLEGMWDTVASSFEGAPVSELRRARLEEDLDVIEEIVAQHDVDEPCMLALAAVPYWRTWQHMNAAFDIVARVRARGELRRWLDRVSAYEPLQAIAPDMSRVIAIHALP